MDEVFRPSREVRKETASLEELNGPVGIRKGVQCKNWAVDQNKIIGLLNKIPVEFGGTLYPSGPTRFKAPRDGYCDPSLSELIRKFQQVNGLGSDGVVDPGGATYPLLRKYASGSLPKQPSKTTSIEEQKFFEDVQMYVAVLDLILRNHRGLFAQAVESQLQLLKREMEALLTKANFSPHPRKPLPVRNNAGVVIGIGALIVIGAGILLYMTTPGYRKHADRVGRHIAHEISIRVEVAQEKLTAAKNKVVQETANAVAAVSAEAQALTRRYRSCEPDAKNLAKIAAEIYILKDHPVARMPFLLESWLKAFAALMRCLGDRGFPLFERLQQIWEAIQHVIGLFPLNRIAFLQRF